MEGRGVLAAVVTLLVLLTGCGDSFDEDGLDAIEDWTARVIPAGEQASGDFALVVLDRGDPSQPLEDHHEDLEELYDEIDELPDDEEIASWQFNRTVGGEQFAVDGEDLAEVVAQLQFALGNLADEIERYLESDGDIDEEDLEWIEDALVSFDEAADDYRALMHP